MKWVQSEENSNQVNCCVKAKIRAAENGKDRSSPPPHFPALILSAAHLSIDPSSLIIWGPLGPIVKNKSLGPLDGLRAWRYICLALNGTKLTKHLQGK